MHSIDSVMKLSPEGDVVVVVNKDSRKKVSDIRWRPKKIRRRERRKYKNIVRRERGMDHHRDQHDKKTRSKKMRKVYRGESKFASQEKKG